MNTKLIRISGIAAVLVSSVIVAEVAAAQGPGPGNQPGSVGPNTPPAQMQPMRRNTMRGQMGRSDESLVAVAAKVIGVTQTELVTALNSGQTIADVAKVQNVDLTKIVDAYVAEKVADRQAMVTSGRWTQAQLDTMTAMMKANITQKLSQPFQVQGAGTGWVDANGDGICDSMPSNHNQPMWRRGPSGNA